MPSFPAFFLRREDGGEQMVTPEGLIWLFDPATGVLRLSFPVAGKPPYDWHGQDALQIWNYLYTQAFHIN